MDLKLRILVITDIHYATCAADAAGPKNRHCLRGREFLGKALRASAGQFDVLALMGDMLNNGQSSHAAEALGELREELDQHAGDIPRLIIPGNHDENPQLLMDTLAGRAGLHEIGGYRFIVCADHYEGIIATRTDTDRRAIAEIAAQPGGPLVLCQHNPIHPPIEADYPYMLTRYDEVMGDYARAGVMLSLSGHYHAGQPVSRANGTIYITAPALCEPPHPTQLVTLRNHEITVTSQHLAD